MIDVGKNGYVCVCAKQRPRLPKRNIIIKSRTREERAAREKKMNECRTHNFISASNNATFHYTHQPMLGHSAMGVLVLSRFDIFCVCAL